MADRKLASLGDNGLILILCEGYMHCHRHSIYNNNFYYRTH